MQKINGYNAQTFTPKFTSIRSIKCKGLYKKAPEEAQKLIDAFEKNDFAMDFCKNKYDVKIVFDATKKKDKRISSSINSSMKILVYNPTTSILKKFWQTITRSRTKVTICRKRYSSLEDSTYALAESILPYDPPEFSSIKEAVRYNANRGFKGELSKKLNRIDKKK